MTKRNGSVSGDDLVSWRRYDEDAIASLMDKLKELDAEENVLVPRLTSIRAERENHLLDLSPQGRKSGKDAQFTLGAG